MRATLSGWTKKRPDKPTKAAGPDRQALLGPVAAGKVCNLRPQHRDLLTEHDYLDGQIILLGPREPHSWSRQRRRRRGMNAPRPILAMDVTPTRFELSLSGRGLRHAQGPTALHDPPLASRMVACVTRRADVVDGAAVVRPQTARA